MTPIPALTAAFVALLMATTALGATVSPPEAVLGHVMGENRYVPNYSDTIKYWQVLASQSDRIRLVDIGPTTEKRRQIMAIVSSPENLALLDQYKDISVRLGRAEGLSDDAARDLAAKGKSIVWVDGGIHASEVETDHALIQEVYDIVSSDDAEARKIRDNVIVLFAADNPDGQEYVADWYMRFKNPADRETNFDSLPKLYHPYIGHDNNRDFYMAEMAETQNITRVLYHDWRPQIILNQHQVGPAGTVVFIPPFRDPFNYNYHPLAITSLEEVGAALNSRLLSEGKVGAVTRSDAHYDTWTNGNLRTSTYFHNAIGLLVEIIGGVTPEPIQLVPERQLPKNDQPAPVAPQMWTMAQSVAYSVAINRATLTYAAANREKVLYNIYRMGKDSIDAGNRDSWTVTPDRIAAMHAASLAAGQKPVPTRTTGSSSIDSRFYDDVLHDPAYRDARAYIISPDQHDFPTAVRFLNALIKMGVTVERARTAFTQEGKAYPAGSYIVKAAQAYRPHLRDMFEPQDYAENFEYPGGPPIPPADASGYTLAYQMGVHYDRALEAVSVATETVDGLLKPYPGRVVGSGKAGFLISHATNNSFILTNRLMKARQQAFWLRAPTAVGDGKPESGAIWVPNTPQASAIVRSASAELGIDAYALDTTPKSPKTALKAPRIALVDVYGGVMPSGWTRWIFEQFEFPYTIVHPQALDRGRLNAKYDIVLMSDSLLPNRFTSKGGGMFRGRFENKQPDPSRIPAEYRDWLGTITTEKTIPALQDFVKNGGALIAIGSTSQGIIDAFGLPVQNGTTRVVDGQEQVLPRTQFYVPGALLTATTDTTTPLGYGLEPKVDLFFDSSPVFRLRPEATDAHTPIRFEGKDIVHSGWALGTDYLQGTAAVVDLSYGNGRVFLFGPEVALRAQTQGAFKLMFNALYDGALSRKK
ncbi:M14 family metallopeptidase [Asticcacaulis sp. 201]|uniref:M14 family metallopeptidase n=1 Tax=Asticcacaulis sp. 201 TaxID=3028787 RepID=UPI0029164A16|nr:M14 family metallopeptidase [Asticcacaulis sp. 201]MDV6330845.1 M14 family metallopeptidase [Asticcacaulis sp. 201]